MVQWGIVRQPHRHIRQITSQNAFEQTTVAAAGIPIDHALGGCHVFGHGVHEVAQPGHVFHGHCGLFAFADGGKSMLIHYAFVFQ